MASSSSSHSAYLRSLMIKRCMISDVIKAPPLQEMLDKKFRIVNYDKRYFNTFSVMEVETHRDDLFHLREEILEVVEEPSLKLYPNGDYVGLVVLAQNPCQNYEYQRALIESLKFEGPFEHHVWANVYFFDFGDYGKVKLVDMKPVTKPIMEFPVLSYKVCLYVDKKSQNLGENTPFDAEGLLLYKRFLALMEKLKMLDLRIELVAEAPTTDNMEPTGTGIVDEHFVVHPVSISYSMKKEKKVLTDELESLKTWEWERLLKGSSAPEPDDDFFRNNGAFGKVPRSVDVYLPELEAEFTAEITYAYPTTSEQRLRTVWLNDDIYTNFVSVLHNQMERYAKMVKKSLYIPPHKEVFMIKFDKTLDHMEKEIPQLGKWCRALLNIRKHKWIYLLDWDYRISLYDLCNDCYDMRRLYGEFLQVPLLVVPIEVPFMLTNLFPGLRYKFKIKSVKADGTAAAEYLGAASLEDEDLITKLKLELTPENEPDRRYLESDWESNDSSSSSTTTTTTTTTSSSEDEDGD